MTDVSSEAIVEVQQGVNDNIARNLAAGLLALYQPELKKVQQQLNELTKKQSSLVDLLQDENRRFNDAQTSEDLQQMFAMIKLYQAKLVGVKKEMSQLHDRSTKLKKRAMKLQQMKQKAALQREQQLQREADLIAKPSASGSAAN